MLDILIRNGEVIDGTGSRRRRADVAVEGDRIVDVGPLPGARAKTVIDATGHIVAPGFVDMHSHADFSLPLVPTADSLLRQGITTVVPFQCGSSPAPILPDRRQELAALLTDPDPDKRLPLEKWSTFGSFLDYLEEIGISPNVVPLVGQSTVRTNELGFSAAAPDDKQMERMQALVTQAMDEGAIGVSTGLIYPPGSFATTRELIDVTRPAGARGGYYFSHIRGEGGELLQAVGEAIHIGKATGASVEVSHFKAAGPKNWHLVHPALALIDQARNGGQDVAADMYPYMAASTSLVTMLPEWAQDGGAPATLKHLQDPETRKRLAVEMVTVGFLRDTEWDKLLISGSPRNLAYQGHYVSELAEAEHKSPTDWVMDALLETQLDLLIIAFAMSEENRIVELKRPYMMIGTDGFAFKVETVTVKDGLPHPRNFGTFPCILGRHVRELRTLSVEEAVYKMTGLAAKWLRLSDRGTIRCGYKADIVVFDPQTVADKATYQNPCQYPAGIPFVVVNGQVVVREGAHTGARPGKVLRWTQ